jgi:hypothetical protein
MRSPYVAQTAAKLLVALALGAASQITPSDAATKCPSGQILRVSKGVCVPKDENLALVSKHAMKPRPADKEAALGSSNKVQDTLPSSRDGAGDRPSVSLADGDAPPAVEPQSMSSRAAQAVSSLTSPFGNLFVGAFHSTLSMGFSAAK